MAHNGSKTVQTFVFVVVMGTVSGALLVGLNLLTGPLIAKNEEIKLKSAIMEVLEIPYTKADVLDVFKDKVKDKVKGGVHFFTGPDGSVAFEFSGPGLWGPVYGTISVNPDLKSIRTMRILHQEETPGLGARIAEHDFLKQFRNKGFLPRLLFMPQGKASADNEVDAITGATGSSRALEKLLNGILQKNIELLKG